MTHKTARPTLPPGGLAPKQIVSTQLTKKKKKMMKTRTCLMAPAMAALLLGACSNDEATDSVDLSRPIALSFAPSAPEVTTRATIGTEGATFQADDQVGLYVDGTDYANVCYTCGGNTWDASEVLYWPDAGTHTFRAYYPYMETVSNAITLPADQSTAEAFTKADLMWVKQEQKATNSPITLALGHRMSLIKLDISQGDGITLNEIKEMIPAIHGQIPTVGTWNLETGEVTFAADAAAVESIRPYMDGSDGTTLTYYALVMPNTSFAEKARFFSLADGETTYSYHLNIAGGFTAGQAQYCDFDLTVNRTGISITGFSVSNWTESTTGSGTVSMD